MTAKDGLKLLVVGSIGLLVGVIGGRQIPPAEPPPGWVLYASNAEATDIEPELFVTFPDALTQAAELERLATLVSQVDFCDLPIEVVSITHQTATINLAEHPWNQDPALLPGGPGCAGKSWRTHYFQGSTGGMITSKILLYSLLQPDGQDPWIDAVTFQYQGIPIAPEHWDHVSLAGTFQRDELP